MNQIKDEIVSELMDLGYAKVDILKSIDDVNIRLIWNINSLCLIYSQSKSTWCNGEIIDMFTNQKTNKEWLTVKYNKKSNKNIQRFCKDIKPIHFHFDDEYKYNNKIIQYILGKLKEYQVDDLPASEQQGDAIQSQRTMMDLTKSKETSQTQTLTAVQTDKSQTAPRPKSQTMDVLDDGDLFLEEKLDSKAEINALAMEYKQELDLQRETMVKWKSKIQDLSKEIVNIEQERNIADQEYKNKMTKLKRDIAAMNETTKTQKAIIIKKEHTIRKTQGDIRDMVSAIGVLKKQSTQRKGKLLSISDLLSKVPGDAVSKLKYGKESQKMCVYTHRINHLFYYDHQEEDVLTPRGDLKTKLDAKYIVVRDISVNHPAIGQQMNGKPWFLLIGDSRSALFVAENKEMRDKWVLFVKRSLGQRVTTEKELSVLQGGGPNRHGRAYSAMAPSQSPREKQVSPRPTGRSLSGATGQLPFGHSQSPIDIRTTTKTGTTRIVRQREYMSSTLEFRYPEKVEGCTIMNNGHTVQVNIDGSQKCQLIYKGKPFTLRQFHFHTPSEHTLDAKQYEMEMHLVHTNEQDEIAVLGFIFTTKQRYHKATLKLSKSRAHLEMMAAKQKGRRHYSDEESDDQETDDEFEGDSDDQKNNLKNDNDFLAQFWSQLPPKKTNKDIKLKQAISFDYLFETCSNEFVKDLDTKSINIDMEIFEYQGSLTTPPYTEGVQWLVSKTTHFINNKQLHKLSGCWGHENNARPCQGYFGRTVSLRNQSRLTCV
jgi:carbonic anhydrase